MDTERQARWVARVVAWHNRHPLAQRIAPAQVQGLGFVDLPYSAHDADDARARRGWRAVFSEDFLPGLKTGRIARWALRHGQDTLPAVRDAPVRQLPIDRGRLPADGLALVLWVGTAAVQAGTQQTRVLLGPVAPFPVLGHRLWSRPRMAAAALLLVVLLGTLPALRWLRPVSPPDDDEPAAVQATLAPRLTPSPPAAVMPVAAPLPTPVVLPASAAASAIEPVTATAPAAPATTAAPPATPAPFPPRRPVLDEAARIMAQRAVADARAARAAAQGVTVYAVATPRVRTQAESEIQGAMLQAALANAEVPRGLRVEALPAGADWRAVCWPFMDRGSAERLREQLAARGQRIEVIAF